MRVPARARRASPHLASVGMEERQRRAGPGEDAHVDALRGIGEQRAQRRALLRPCRKSGVKVQPARWTWGFAASISSAMRGSARRRRRAARRGRPRAARATPSPPSRAFRPRQAWVVRAGVSVAREPAAMVGADRSLDAVAELGVESADGRRHVRQNHRYSAVPATPKRRQPSSSCTSTAPRIGIATVSRRLARPIPTSSGRSDWAGPPGSGARDPGRARSRGGTPLRRGGRRAPP